ncbi:MAG: cell wall-associated protease, partial [Saprospiraceae bacterium]
MKFKLFLLAGLVFTATMLSAQEDAAPKDWFHLNPATDNVPGIDTKSTYSKLLKDRKSETVIVAVIDGGVDPMHEDLKDIIWTNPGEIADNGIDDDKNGYVDDIHGWNFIGGKDGQNIGADALEITRLVAKYRIMFKDKDIASLSKKDKKLYDKFQKMEKEVTDEKASWEKRYQESGIPMLKGVYVTLRKELGKQDFTAEDLKTIESTDEEVTQAVTVLQGILERGGTVADLEKRVIDGDSQLLPRVNSYYDPNFDPRSIVGDNYADPTERYYGNGDIKGPDANHGTHVSGIIAASRNNGVGMDGIADNVKIMGVRCVPNGDERDKDVANAIRYAVDNGATVINMSFGKAYSWDKKIVDDA